MLSRLYQFWDFIHGTKSQKSSITLLFLRSVLWFLVTANVDPSSLILLTLSTEAIHSSETSVFKKARLRHIPEDGIFHSYRCEKLKSNNGGTASRTTAVCAIKLI
jgi:hypothetical protein